MALSFEEINRLTLEYVAGAFHCEVANRLTESEGLARLRASNDGYRPDYLRGDYYMTAMLDIYTSRPPNQNAEEKAEVLLKQVLPSDLYDELQKRSYFGIAGKKWFYTVHRHGMTQMYSLGDRDNVQYSACLQLTDGAAPDQDRIVATYLLIKNDEEQFLTTANKTARGQYTSPWGRYTLTGDW